MTESHAAVVDGVDVDAIAAAALACPRVRALRSVGLSEVSTYVPGRIINGVRVEDHAVTISVEIAWGASALAVSDELAAATAILTRGRRVDVVIAAIADPL